MVQRGVWSLLAFTTLAAGAAAAQVVSVGSSAGNPFQRGTEVASMRAFDTLVLDWVIQTTAGRRALALPSDAPDDVRAADLRTVVTARPREMTLAQDLAGACQPLADCMAERDILLEVEPLRADPNGTIRGRYVVFRHAGSRVTSTVYHVWFRRTSRGLLVENVMSGIQ